MNRLLALSALALGFAGAAGASILYENLNDGSAGFVAQDFTDFPTYWSSELDDLQTGAGWNVAHVTIYGSEGGTHLDTDVAVLAIGPDHNLNTLTNYYTGTYVNGNLEFDVNEQWGGGLVYVSSWIRRAYGEGGQWFWYSTANVIGDEAWFHNPSGGFGYGTDPLPISASIASGTPRDMAMTITGEPVPEPATLTVLGLGALALLRRRRA